MKSGSAEVIKRAYSLVPHFNSSSSWFEVPCRRLKWWSICDVWQTYRGMWPGYKKQCFVSTQCVAHQLALMPAKTFHGIRFEQMDLHFLRRKYSTCWWASRDTQVLHELNSKQLQRRRRLASFPGAWKFRGRTWNTVCACGSTGFSGKLGNYCIHFQVAHGNVTPWTRLWWNCKVE